MDPNKLAQVTVIRQMLAATQTLLDDLIAQTVRDGYDPDVDRVNVS